MGVNGGGVVSCSRLREEVVLPMLNLVGPRGKPVSDKLLNLFDRKHSYRVPGSSNGEFRRYQLV